MGTRRSVPPVRGARWLVGFGVRKSLLQCGNFRVSACGTCCERSPSLVHRNPKLFRILRSGGYPLGQDANVLFRSHFWANKSGTGLPRVGPAFIKQYPQTITRKVGIVSPPKVPLQEGWPPRL